MHNHWEPAPCPPPCPPPHRPECGDPIVGMIIDGRKYPYGCVKEEDYLEDKAVLNNTISNKVDKEPGKGLSTEDFTAELLEKLNNIEPQANKTVVDSALSSSSTNPVQNKKVKEALDAKPDVYVQASQPSGLKAGDIWFQISES